MKIALTLQLGIKPAVNCNLLKLAKLNFSSVVKAAPVFCAVHRALAMRLSLSWLGSGRASLRLQRVCPVVLIHFNNFIADAIEAVAAVTAGTEAAQYKTEPYEAFRT